MDKYSEEYITANADTFDWDYFSCNMNKYSQEFTDMFKDEIQNRVWLNKDGKRHRVDGPACEYPSGDKYWHFNGKLHRVDGPAVEYAYGDKHWYLNGINYTEEEYNTKKINGFSYTEEEYNTAIMKFLRYIYKSFIFIINKFNG